MFNRTTIRWSMSPVKALACVAVALALSYVALIALVMNYAALTVGFAQSIRNDETAIAKLEQRYFATLDSISRTDYRAHGYAKPASQTFVTSASVTALR